MKNTKLSTTFALSLVLLLVMAACQPIVAPMDETGADAGIMSDTTVSLSVDALRNATYSGIYDEPVTLVDGFYEGEPYVAGGASRPTARYIAGAERYGDLDGDGLDDAVVFLVESGGGSGNFVYVAAQLNQAGQPVDAGAVMVEDRTQVKAVTVENGQIALAFTIAGPGDGTCCRRPARRS